MPLGALGSAPKRGNPHVVRLAVAVAAELDLQLEAVRNVELRAVLHDIGKVRVPETILNKPGPLTEEEWVVALRPPAPQQD